MKKCFILLLALILVISLTGCKSSDYKQAMELYANDDYAEALAIFTELGDYKDSSSMVSKCKYAMAQQLMAEEDYEGALALFEELGDYEDSAENVKECHYRQAVQLIAQQQYAAAEALFTGLGDYKDSAEYLGRITKDYVLLTERSAGGELHYEYANGLLVKKVGVGKDEDELFMFHGYNFGNSRGVAEYEYDADGNCTEIRVYRKDGTKIHTYTYEYDHNGYLIREISDSLFPNGSHSTYIYQYDGNGNKIQSLWYQNLTGTGNLYNYHYYRYDEHNQLIAEGWEYEWGNKTDITYRNEYDSNGRLIKQSGSNGITHFYEYDQRGNLLLDRVSNSSGGYEYRYEYDDMDCMIKKTYINKNTEEVTAYTYGYVYSFE